MSAETKANSQLVHVALAIIVAFFFATFLLTDRPDAESTDTQDDAAPKTDTVTDTMTDDESSTSMEDDRTTPVPMADAPPVTEAKNATYVHADGSLQPNGERGETRVWSEAPSTDMNGDGVADSLVIIEEVRDDESRTYYIASLLSTEGGFLGGVAQRIGSGVAVQNYRITQGMVLVNYASRAPWESADARPSVGKTKRLTVESDGTLMATDMTSPNDEKLTQLSEQAWGNCDDCTVTNEAADGVDGVWYLLVTHSELKDDSVSAERRWFSLTENDGVWNVGAQLHAEYSCHAGRGHEDFSSVLCS